VARLSEARRPVTRVSAPAGSGKSTLLSEWIASGRVRAGWVSLDADDGDPARFLAHLVAAIGTLLPGFGASVLKALQAPQPPPAEAVLAQVLNEAAQARQAFTLVLDDYHAVDAEVIDQAVTYLVENLPPQMRLVLAGRQDPRLPLARWRARNLLGEIRAQDLRFTQAETAELFRQTTGQPLSEAEIRALGERTEGWAAGLHLAALSLQGQSDVGAFVRSFTGSHRYVVDYLLDEVLSHQPDDLQRFLVQTCVLARMCGPLCDAVTSAPAGQGQAILASLERMNLFVIPLDNERRWYRYHHLFADSLRGRLRASPAYGLEPALHSRASEWLEANGLELEAFHHAVAGGDIDRAQALVEGKGMPLHFRGPVTPVLTWLASLPSATLDQRPALWVLYASVMLYVGDVYGVEPKLQAAERALHDAEPGAHARDLIGHIATIRATLAVSQLDGALIEQQARLALELLRPDNLPVRTAAQWALGYAHQVRGDLRAAHQAQTQALATATAIGHAIIQVMAVIGLATIEEAWGRLSPAAAHFERVLPRVTDPDNAIACEPRLGLARIHYRRNDLESARQQVSAGLALAHQIDSLDWYAAFELMGARIDLAQGEVARANSVLLRAQREPLRHAFGRQEVPVGVHVVFGLLAQGRVAEAAAMADADRQPLAQAAVRLAEGDADAALDLAAAAQTAADAGGLYEQRLLALVVRAGALSVRGDAQAALTALADALALAEPEGYVRVFVDAGPVIARLFRALADRRPLGAFGRRVQEAFQAGTVSRVVAQRASAAALVESLSPRELEILQLTAAGLSNREISERLFLALSTVKGHHQRIFDKLHVQRRTEAIARARDLGLLQ
jgi:LuxR family maltose regulon positive regulatory protein